MLSLDAARRVAAVVRDFEKSRSGEIKRGRGPTIILPLRNALATSDITARSGSTKGHGTATIYCDDGTGSGVMVVSQAGVKTWNAYGEVVASGTWIVVGIVDGLVQVIGADCP